jgi:dTDP-4-amino-4,6-dideoxygalactose transaminase
MDEMMAIAEKYNLYVIEDCAQAHFAQWKEQKVGTFGIAGTFSFFPGKNLGAYGDAGAIITNDDDFADKARIFANHGALKKHQHAFEGINSRLDGIQASILSVKLKYIDDWNNKRLKNANLYNRLLDGLDGITIPQIRDNVKHVFHLYVIRAENREALKKYLAERGVSTGIHYPAPLPLLAAYKYLNHTPSDFPVASDYMDKILSLPMFAELTVVQVEYIADAIKEFYR